MAPARKKSEQEKFYERLAELTDPDALLTQFELFAEDGVDSIEFDLEIDDVVYSMVAQTDDPADAEPSSVDSESKSSMGDLFGYRSMTAQQWSAEEAHHAQLSELFQDSLKMQKKMRKMMQRRLDELSSDWVRLEGARDALVKELKELEAKRLLALNDLESLREQVDQLESEQVVYETPKDTGGLDRPKDMVE